MIEDDKGLMIHRAERMKELIFSKIVTDIPDIADIAPQGISGVHGSRYTHRSSDSPT
jgi:hypothetical protein